MRNTNYIVEKLLNTLDKESEWTYLGKWQKKIKRLQMAEKHVLKYLSSIPAKNAKSVPNHEETLTNPHWGALYK